MGIKEKVQGLEGKPLMDSFFAAEMIDVAATKIDLSLYGGKELHPFAVEFMKNFGQDGVYIFHTAIIVGLIGLYGVSSQYIQEIRTGSRTLNLKYASERTLQWGRVFAWGVAGLGVSQLAVDTALTIHKSIS